MMRALGLVRTQRWLPAILLKNWWHGWVNLSLFPPFMHLCNVSAYRNVVSGIDRICLIDTYPACIRLGKGSSQVGMTEKKAQMYGYIACFTGRFWSVNCSRNCRKHLPV